jgi:hypothetical protein
MSKKIKIFDVLMEGFQDAIARKKGKQVALRIAEIPRVKSMLRRRADLAKVQTPLPDSRRSNSLVSRFAVFIMCPHQPAKHIRELNPAAELAVFRLRL